MKNDYKRLYENANYMLTRYQDEIVPGFREQVELQEKQIAELTESFNETAAECDKLRRRIASMKKRYRPIVYGRWQKYDESKYCYCSYCGKPAATDENVSWHGFCPCCGAIMRNDGKK